MRTCRTRWRSGAWKHLAARSTQDARVVGRADLNDIPEWAQGWQNLRGRAHDLLWMAKIAVRQAGAKATEVVFDMILCVSGDPAPEDGRGEGEWGSMRTYKLVCGPNDDGSPCLTVMRVDED